MRILNYILIFGLINVGITGCYYDNEVELYPQPIECDTTNVTYNATIAPIMNNSCNGCHSSSAPSANVITDTYEGVKVIAENGKLWGTLNHEQGYSPMPKGFPKLNDCDLTKINIWLNNGALND